MMTEKKKKKLTWRAVTWRAVTRRDNLEVLNLLQHTCHRQLEPAFSIYSRHGASRHGASRYFFFFFFSHHVNLSLNMFSLFRSLLASELVCKVKISLNTSKMLKVTRSKPDEPGWWGIWLGIIAVRKPRV